METKQLETALFTIAIFGLGAVAIILYQHSLHTGQIVSAISGASKTSGPQVIAPADANPSAAGIIPGQANIFNPVPPDVLVVGSNWELH